MDEQIRHLTDFFRRQGADSIPHAGEKPYLAHAIGVYSDLKSWGCDRDLCLAGLFHSVYGTQSFQKFAFPLERRSEIEDLIGRRAEQLVYWNCVMDRAAFDESIQQTSGPYVVVNRITGERIDLEDSEFDRLVTLHLCDWLEQVARSAEWDYRRAAYRQMAERLGGVALEAQRRVYSGHEAAKSS